MSQQMSFEFAQGDAPPSGRIPRATRKRIAPMPPYQNLAPHQLPLAPPPAQRLETRPPIKPRIPFTAPASAPNGMDSATGIHEARLWSENGWTARVIKNEDDDGWAVEVRRDNKSEPLLLAPWNTDHDLRNPRPLDQSAFNGLVKTAAEIQQRHEQQIHARLHKRLTVNTPDSQWEVTLEIVPDEYEAHALLTAFDESGALITQERVAPDFKLTAAVAQTWIENDFRHPGRDES